MGERREVQCRELHHYCEMIIDGMDMDTLCQLAYDLLMDAYKDSTEEELREEILDLYDEEMLESFVHCPSAPYENSSFVDIDDAWGLCLDLSEEFGYAEVRQGEHMLGSYTNGQ
jgi:hypothetical protein